MVEVVINTKIVIATIISWNISNAEQFRISHPDWSITIISDKSKLTIERLNEIKLDFVFFPTGHGLFRKIYLNSLHASYSI